MPSATADVRRPRGLPAARGFTTIELMVAIAIIVVLLGIVVFGYRKVVGGSQENQTRTILERMRSMQSALTANKAGSEKFFQAQIPAIYVTSGTEWESVPANSNLSLLATAKVLGQLQRNVESKAIFDELATNRKKTLYLDPTDGREVASNTPGAVSAIFPLDSWGNPLLFVFDNWQESVGPTQSKLRTTNTGGATGGLTNLESKSNKVYWQPTAQVSGVSFTYTTGYTSSGATALRSPDRQPFWVSGGPDGDFRTHDDNIYSFDN